MEGWQKIQWKDDRQYNGGMTDNTMEGWQTNTMAESHSTGSHFYQTLTFELLEEFGDPKE